MDKIDGVIPEPRPTAGSDTDSYSDNWHSQLVKLSYSLIH